MTLAMKSNKTAGLPVMEVEHAGKPILLPSKPMPVYKLTLSMTQREREEEWSRIRHAIRENCFKKTDDPEALTISK